MISTIGLLNLGFASRLLFRKLGNQSPLQRIRFRKFDIVIQTFVSNQQPLLAISLNHATKAAPRQAGW